MLRTEGDEGREVNHHGKTIVVGGEEVPQTPDNIEDFNSQKRLFTEREGSGPKKKKHHHHSEKGDLESEAIVSKWKKTTSLVQVLSSGNIYHLHIMVKLVMSFSQSHLPPQFH